MLLYKFAIALAVTLAGVSASAQKSAQSNTSTVSSDDSRSYADLADLFADAPVVARVKVSQMVPLKTPPPAVLQRFYIEARLVTLIRASGAMAPVLRYLADMAPDSRGRTQKLKGTDVLVAGRSGRPGELQLAATDAQLKWSPTLEVRVRQIVAASIAPGAPPAILGIGSAFHVAGTLAGEGETQIFLTTRSGAPVSLNVLRRPGEAPSWAAAFGEIVDGAATAPAKDSLGWWRLACFLPATLPDKAVSELGPSDAVAARTDYAFVMKGLGTCPRTRPQK